MPLQDRRRRMHRTEPHLSRIQTSPLAIADAPKRLQTVTLDSRLRSQDKPRGAIGNLRAVARRDPAVLLVEERPQFGQGFWRRIGTHAIVLGIHRAILADQGDDLSEVPSCAACNHAPVTFDRECIHRLPRDAETPGQILGGLAHRQADHRIGQTLEDADHRCKQSSWAQTRKGGDFLADPLGLHQCSKPQHHRPVIKQRGMRQGVYAARQHKFGAPALNACQAGINGLHAAGAIPHHGPGRHFLTAPHAQCGHPTDIDFVRRGARATENHLVKGIRRKRLPYQQRPPGLHRQIRRGKWPWTTACFQKRRPCAVNHIHGLKCHVSSVVPQPNIRAAA